MEASHSGLVRMLGKHVCPKGHREFDSHRLRACFFWYNVNIYA